MSDKFSETKQFLGFLASYKKALKDNQQDVDKHLSIFETLLSFIEEELKSPFQFEPYHKSILEPIDYHRFGLDFIRPIVDKKNSFILDPQRFDEIETALQKKENVILFSNHQTELDPQAIKLLLEKSHSRLSQEMIFVAGHRVTTDPVAIPFSKGCNLLCIYSKNYVEHPPEKKMEKVHHNQKTMKRMRDLLNDGGRCIYVAPSGGRDRKSTVGKIEISRFDPQSIEMFLFISKHSSKRTHFYPLALSTYDLLPPPEKVNVTLGEERLVKKAAIRLGIGNEIDLDEPVHLEQCAKKEFREKRAEFIWNLVKDSYAQISLDV